MRMKSAFLVGFQTMIATTGCVVHTMDRFTETVRRVDVIERIGHRDSTYSPYILDGAADGKFSAEKMASVAVTERIGHGNSSIHFIHPTRTDGGGRL